MFVYYRPQVVAKVIFLHLSVIHSVHRGRGSASVHAGIPPPRPGRIPPWEQTPPDQADTPQGADTLRTRQTPLDQADPPEPGRHPPLGSRLQHTGYSAYG